MFILALIVIFFLLIFILVSYVIHLKRDSMRHSKALQISMENSKKLQEENIELEAILQAIQDGVIITGLDDHIKLASLKAAAILRTDVFKLKDHDVSDFLPMSGLKEKFNTDLTTDVKLQNGETITLEIKVLPIISQEQLKGAVITLHDKTQEKIFEEMKLDFVTMAAHQLRTPLTSLKGYLYLLSQSVLNKLSKEEKLFLDRSINGAEKLSSLTEYLINATRIGESKLNLNLKMSSLGDVVAQAVTENEQVSTKKGISITYEKPEGSLPSVMIDPNLIETVLNNLILNAIEHSDTKRIVVRAKKSDQDVLVEVQDYGKGIPSYAVEHLFTKFFKVPSHLLASTGSGLGLYVSKLIVQAHGGKIWVNSLEGKGSTFTFSLPTVNNVE